MGGRGSSGTAKIPSMGGTTKSNAKYKGFSVTRDGRTENYIVVNGTVQYADGRDRKESSPFASFDSLEMMQKAYDLEGSTKGVIERINSIGQATASPLADKKVTELRKKRKKQREQAEKNYSPRNSKRGVNRKTAYWSAM